MTSLIKYYYEDIIAIQVEDKSFYIDTSGGYPKVYDDSLNKMIISDYDSWLLNLTDNQVDLRVLKLMAQSFKDGMSINHDYDDLLFIMDKTAQLVISCVFRTDLAKQFCEFYWVEVLNDQEYNKLKAIIKSNFESMAGKYGNDKLYNICCRIWQYCNLNLPDESVVFEKIINKNLNKKPKLPEYPNTESLDQLVIRLVEGMLFGDQQLVKNVSPRIVANTKNVYTRRV